MRLTIERIVRRSGGLVGASPLFFFLKNLLAFFISPVVKP